MTPRQLLFLSLDPSNRIEYFYSFTELQKGLKRYSPKLTKKRIGGLPLYPVETNGPSPMGFFVDWNVVDRYIRSL